MTQGRGNAHAMAMLLLILALQSCGLWHSASAATHNVGGSQRWDVGIDYTAWAVGQTFKVGDILFFPYSPEEHNVVVVDKAGYDACSDANAIATFNDGNTNVTLSTTGSHYYLCSVVGHCAAGMKLAVTVSAAAAAPAPPPLPTAPPPSTAPSPSKTPLSSPNTTPSPTPSSTSTPFSSPNTTPSPTPSSAPSPSSPAPTPSAEAPVSATTPSSPAPVPTMGPSASSPGAPGSTPPSPGTPLPSPPSPNSASSFLPSAAIAPLLALLVAFTV